MSGSTAIAYFVANEQLRGKSFWKQAQVFQWVSIVERAILPAFNELKCLWTSGQSARDPDEMSNRYAIKALMRVLNQHLSNRTFFVGEHVSLADIVVFNHLLILYGDSVESSERSQLMSWDELLNLNRWFNNMLNQPQVFSILPNFKLATEAIEFDAKRYADANTVAAEPRNTVGYAEQTIEMEGVSIYVSR